MNEPGRKRIDVSNELHARLETEARRKGISLRDLIDRIVLETLERAGDADASPGRLERPPEAAQNKSFTMRLAEVIARFDALVERLATELPAAIGAGFDGVRKTITETGGTGHLRTMLAEQDKAQTKRLVAMETGAEKGRNAQTLLFEKGNRELAVKIDTLRDEVARLGQLNKGRRWSLALGAAGTLIAAGASVPLLADTPAGRSLAIRLTGETTAVGAAYTLIGNGSVTGGIMAQTKALLDDPQFRSDYTRCMTHTREVKRRFSCRVSMPPYAPKAS
jgi:hypothetical protein